MGTKRYSVNLWGSKPGTDDDCWSGAEFDTEAEARACYLDPWPHFYPHAKRETAWVELDGPDIHEERRNHSFQRRRRDDGDDWRREQAMQAGMGLGVEAYNDAMGWSVDDR